MQTVAAAIMEVRDGCKVTDWDEANWNPVVKQALLDAEAAIKALEKFSKNPFTE